MGWRRRQSEGDRGSRRPRAERAVRDQGVQYQVPVQPEQPAPVTTGHGPTFWQQIGIGEYEVGPQGYTGRSRMAARR